MQSPQPNASVTARILPGDGEDQVLRILESITDGFCAFDVDWRIIFSTLQPGAFWRRTPAETRLRCWAVTTGNVFQAHAGQ